MGARTVMAVVALVAVAGYAAADAVDRAPGVLTLAAPTVSAAPARPTAYDPPRLRTAAVLPDLSLTARLPSRAGVASAVGPLLRAPALGPRVSAYVVDAATGEVLLDAAAGRPMVPASATKLLTAAAALSVVGAATRLSTRVVQGSSPDEVVVVGGGDMLLGPGRSSPAVVGRAGLADLAAQVAVALRAAGQRRVVVRVDDTLFAGPNASPAWRPGDVSGGYTGRVAALGIGTDRARPGHPSTPDPALTAATAFAAALRRAGVAVAGAPARTVAPEGARVLGQVDSAVLADVLGVALRESDNALAEVMARLVARATGRPATFPDAASAVLDEVQQLGVDVGPATIKDGSGLAGGSLVPARVLGDVLGLAASAERPGLRPLLQGLPVAGFTGTLADRFAAPPGHAAAGLVRAKTGTLTGTNVIAGSTVDADGRLLVFVVMADRVPVGGTSAARAAVDGVAAALARCGCR